MLQLKNLRINLVEWGNDKGRLTGEIEYAGDKGRVTLTLNAKDCERLLPLIGEAVVAASKEVAEQLTQESLSSMPSATLKIS